MRLVRGERISCLRAIPSVVVPGGAPGYVQKLNGWEMIERFAWCNALPSLVARRNAESCETDGRVKIGESIAEMLLEGSEVKCLFSHFALCLMEELESACAPLAFPTGTCQAKAPFFLFFFFVYIISTCLKEKSAQMSKQTNKATNNWRS